MCGWQVKLCDPLVSERFRGKGLIVYKALHKFLGLLRTLRTQLTPYTER